MWLEEVTIWFIYKSYFDQNKIDSLTNNREEFNRLKLKPYKIVIRVN